ncbi:MAG: hypothetical protein JNL01_05785 [Bdellovibrionales bacterium]|nr:hypothetical protein [Bdellovibrionales bacterium]
MTSPDSGTAGSKLKKTRSRFRWEPRKTEALRFGLIAAMASVVISTAAMEVTWQSLSQETQGFIQQSLGDTTTLISGHIKTELEGLVLQLRDIASRMPRETGIVEPKPALGWESDWLSIAVWRKINADAVNTAPVALGKPPVAPEWKRTAWMANSTLFQRIPDLGIRVRSQEALERSWAEAAAQKPLTLRLENTVIEPGGTLWMSGPMGLNDEVWVAQIQLGRLNRLLPSETMVNSLVIDAAGMVAAHPGGKTGSPRALPQFALIQKSLQGNQAEIKSNQFRMEDPSGSGGAYYGGYRRVGVGGLTIVSYVTEADARAGLSGFRVRSIVFVFISFLFAGIVGSLYSWSKIRRNRRLLKSASSSALQQEAETWAGNDVVLSAKRAPVVLVFGTVRNQKDWMKEANPDWVVEAVSDWLTLVKSRAVEFMGHFEMIGGNAYAVTWAAREDHLESVMATRFAMTLRRDLDSLNQARKIDGMPAIWVGMGVHSDSVVLGKVGPAGGRKVQSVGEILACARVLENIALHSGLDMVISKNVWEDAKTAIYGHWVGEAKLSQYALLMEYFWPEGLLEDSNKIRILTPYSRPVENAEDLAGSQAQAAPEAATPAGTDAAASAGSVMVGSEPTWLVNNGSQMLGPLNAKQIAQALFAQELDFDCECWAGSAGGSAKIRDAKIFSSTVDASATGWVFDGETLHGPMTESFIRAAFSRGAIPDHARICFESTVQGWVEAAQWLKDHPVKAVTPPPFTQAPVVEAAPVVQAPAPEVVIAPSVAPSVAPSESPEAASPVAAVVLTEYQPGAIVAIEESSSLQADSESPKVAEDPQKLKDAA